jgi:aspartokinase
VGKGAVSTPGILALALSEHERAGMVVEGMVSTSLRATLVLPRSQVHESTRLLHRKLLSKGV